MTGQDDGRHRIPASIPKIIWTFPLALRLMRGSACPAMQLLYKAFACEDLDGKKLLLPGFSARPDMRRLQQGQKIRVELADST